MLASGLGALLMAQGAQGLAADELGVIPGVSDLACALRVAEAVARSGADVVVWDAGSLDSLLRAALSVSSTALLLDRYLTPAALLLSSRTDPGVVAAVQALQAACARAEQALWPGAEVHVVMSPTQQALAQVRAAIGAMAAWGCRVHRVIVNGVPEPGAGWPEPWAAERRASAQDARAALSCVPGCDVALLDMLACPADERPARIGQLMMSRSTLGRADLRGATDLRPMTDLRATTDECHRADGPDSAGSGGLVAGWIPVEPDGPGYRLLIPLPCVDRADLRVGRSAGHLVLAIGGLRRAIRLPAHLRRCTLQGARLDTGVLTIRMQPDPDAWRDQGRTEPAAGAHRAAAEAGDAP